MLWGLGFGVVGWGSVWFYMWVFLGWCRLVVWGNEEVLEISSWGWVFLGWCRLVVWGSEEELGKCLWGWGVVAVAEEFWKGG